MNTIGPDDETKERLVNRNDFGHRYDVVVDVPRLSNDGVHRIICDEDLLDVATVCVIVVLQTVSESDVDNSTECMLENTGSSYDTADIAYGTDLESDSGHHCVHLLEIVCEIAGEYSTDGETVEKITHGGRNFDRDWHSRANKDGDRAGTDQIIVDWSARDNCMLTSESAGVHVDDTLVDSIDCARATDE